MSINGLASTAYSQMFQAPPQRSGGQIIQQQAAAPQGPSDESKENASQQSQENEGTEASSINLYA